MEQTTIRQLDELGRLVIPQDIRDALGWQPGERMAICIDDIQIRSINIRPERRCCALCGEFTENLQIFQKAHICANCRAELAAAQ